MANIFQQLRRAFIGGIQTSASPGPSRRKVAPFLWPGYITDQPQWQLTDYSSYVNEGFNLNALIYSAIMYKARAQTVAPLRAYEGDVDDPQPLDPGHELAQLLMRPNEHQSQIEFRQQAIVYINISGDNFAFLDRSAPTAALPSAMYNLRPDRVLILPGRENGRATVKGYVYTPEGVSAFSHANNATRAQMLDDNRAVVIYPDDILHTKFPNPGDPLEGMGYGLSPISPLARSADVDNSITHFLKLFFQNGVMLPGILSSDQPLDDAAIARIKERWKEMYGGYDRWAEEIGVLERGTSYQRVGLGFDEMGFGVQDERNESRILGPFGVPPILIGSRIGLERSTFSNYREARQAFWEDTMIPENALFEADYGYALDGDGAFVRYDYQDVPAFWEQRQAQVQAVAEAFKAGAVTRNQYLRALGLPQIEGPQGNRYVISPMMVEVPVQMGESPAAVTDESGKIIYLPEQRASRVKKKAIL